MADPRKGDEHDNLNEFLRDFSLRHRLGLDRTAGSIRNDALELLNQSDQDIQERLQTRLQRGMSEGTVRTKQLRKLQSDIKQINREVMGDVDKKLKQRLRELAISEAEMQKSTIASRIPVDVGMSIPQSNQLKAIVDSQPFEGNTLSQWTSKVTRDRTENIVNEVRKGMIEGDSNQEIVSRVMGTRQFANKDGVLDKSRRNVAAITRTAVTKVTDTASEMTYRQNSRVIQGVQYVATLDSRTTIICSTLDSREFNIGQGPRPPQHFGCRSTTAPLTKSWQDMGISRQELSHSTRASMNGQVPEGKTMRDFIDSPNGPGAEDILGSTRAELWRNSDLDFQDFLRGGIKTNNEVMTINELRKQHSEAFKQVS